MMMMMLTEIEWVLPREASDAVEDRSYDILSGRNFVISFFRRGRQYSFGVRRVD
jgi:hypothetical protein